MSTVLIVDDEILLLSVVALEAEDAGFDVITAATPQKALEVLEGSSEVDVLFTDIRMPGPIDGWQLGDRAQKLRRDLPVIYATGYSAAVPEHLAKGSLFLKPYNVGSVIEAMRKAVA